MNINQFDRDGYGRFTVSTVRILTLLADGPKSRREIDTALNRDYDSSNTRHQITQFRKLLLIEPVNSTKRPVLFQLTEQARGYMDDHETVESLRQEGARLKLMIFTARDVLHAEIKT